MQSRRRGGVAETMQRNEGTWTMSQKHLRPALSYWGCGVREPEKSGRMRFGTSKC